MKICLLAVLCSLILICASAQDSSQLAVDSVQGTVGSLQSAGDSLQVRVDSGQVAVGTKRYDSAFEKLLGANQYLNTRGEPVSMVIRERKAKGNEFYFYLFSAILLLLGILRLVFSRYFTNLFRVFFNTSLRQSQLTDQLLQAKLPSLLFNIFFVISGGLYLYFLLGYFGWIDDQDRWMLIGSCMAVIAGIYIVKFSTLKFTGWVTGFKEATNTYVFIIFLINKIIGVLLVPLVILIAFSRKELASVAVIFSLICVGFLLILRFFRSYGLLQNQLKISRFHFFLYIAGVELVPLLLLYKSALLLLTKNP